MRAPMLVLAVAACTEGVPLEPVEDAPFGLRRVADVGGSVRGAVVSDGGQSVYVALAGVTARWRVDLGGFDRAQDVAWSEDRVSGRDGAVFSLGPDNLYVLPDVPLDPDADVQPAPGPGEQLDLPEFGPLTLVPTENDRRPLGAWATERGTVSLQLNKAGARCLVQWHDLDVTHGVLGDRCDQPSAVAVDLATADVLLAGAELWALSPEEDPQPLGDARLVARHAASETVLTWDGRALVATDGPRRLLWRATPPSGDVAALDVWEDEDAFLVWVSATERGIGELLFLEPETGALLASVGTAPVFYPNPGVQAVGDTVVVWSWGQLEVLTRTAAQP